MEQAFFMPLINYCPVIYYSFKKEPFMESCLRVHGAWFRTVGNIIPPWMWAAKKFSPSQAEYFPRYKNQNVCKQFKRRDVPSPVLRRQLVQGIRQECLCFETGATSDTAQISAGLESAQQTLETRGQTGQFIAGIRYL